MIIFLKKYKSKIALMVFICVLVCTVSCLLDFKTIEKQKMPGLEKKSVFMAAENTVAKNTDKAVNEPRLHAVSAALYDADDETFIYGKNMRDSMANASTTKILTCIVALEKADINDTVTISQNAASQPEVKLGLVAGNSYNMKDLLYGMMLESFNDCAYAIAEHVGGSTEGFAKLMNEKANEIGCLGTYFITPNGLDASDETGEHATTAKELAVIMSYCIQNEEFLAITQAKEHQFGSYSVSNANAFLNMYDGVLSGKTGFTGNAGYCYVCACRYDGKTFIAALLACGWPPSKTYKWQDCRTLLNWGKEHFNHEEIIGKNFPLKSITVTDGLEKELPVSIHDTCRLLLRKEDLVNVVINTPDSIAAPVFTGDIVGSVCVYVNDALLFSTPVYADACIRRTDYLYFLNQVIKSFCFIDK